jgi:hypothetical protein
MAIPIQNPSPPASPSLVIRALVLAAVGSVDAVARIVTLNASGRSIQGSTGRTVAALHAYPPAVRLAGTVPPRESLPRQPR